MKKIIGYFDFLCPYCYLGTNYAHLMQQEIPRVIEWHPIEIHPDLPIEGQPLEVALPHVKDPVERVKKLRELAEKINLPVIDDRWFPNTKKALLAMEFARDHGKEAAFMPAVFNAYFGSGLDIGNEEVILALAEAVGLDGEKLKKAWNEGTYLERLRQNEKESLMAEVEVVPTLVLDGKKVLAATTTMTFAEYAEKFRQIPK